MLDGRCQQFCSSFLTWMKNDRIAIGFDSLDGNGMIGQKYLQNGGVADVQIGPGSFELKQESHVPVVVAVVRSVAPGIGSEIEVGFG